MKHGHPESPRREATHERSRAWSPPRVEDLPRLEDLTLDTLGAGIGGSGNGSGFGF
jgi:hypothetical protein